MSDLKRRAWSRRRRPGKCPSSASANSRRDANREALTSDCGTERDRAAMSAGAATLANARIRVYARASHPLQDTSVEQQIDAAETDLKACGLLSETDRLPRHHAPAHGVYVDDGISAWKVPPSERPGSAQLLTDVACHPHNREAPGIIWVWAQSRLLRPEFGGAEAVAQLFELRKLGWILLSHDEGRLDVIGDEGLLHTVKVSLTGEKDAEHSRAKQSNVRRAKRRQAEAGLWLGGFPPIGYERWAVTLGPEDPTSHRSTIEHWVQILPLGTQNGIQRTRTVLRPSAQADIVRRIFSLAAHGDHGCVVSIYEIARRLNVEGLSASIDRPRPWCHTTIDELLTNETYIAIQRDPEDEPHPALWEPLVSRDVWDRVQTRLHQNKQSRRGVNTEFPLTGILYCASCGGRLCGERQRRRSNATYRYYKSNGHSTGALAENRCPACRPRLRADHLEAHVLKAVASIDDHHVVRHAIAAEQAARKAGERGVAEREARLTAELEEVHRQMDGLIATLQTTGGAFHERLQGRIAELNAAVARIERDREDLANGATFTTAHTFATSVASFDAAWAKASNAERKELLRYLVERVEINALTASVRIGIRRPSPRLADAP